MKAILTTLAIVPGLAWAHGESHSLMHYLTAPEHVLGLIAILAVGGLCAVAVKRQLKD